MMPGGVQPTQSPQSDITLRAERFWHVLCEQTYWRGSSMLKLPVGDRAILRNVHYQTPFEWKAGISDMVVLCKIMPPKSYINYAFK